MANVEDSAEFGLEGTGQTRVEVDPRPIIEAVSGGLFAFLHNTQGGKRAHPHSEHYIPDIFAKLGEGSGQVLLQSENVTDAETHLCYTVHNFRYFTDPAIHVKGVTQLVAQTGLLTLEQKTDLLRRIVSDVSITHMADRYEFEEHRVKQILRRRAAVRAVMQELKATEKAASNPYVLPEYEAIRHLRVLVDHEVGHTAGTIARVGAAMAAGFAGMKMLARLGTK